MNYSDLHKPVSQDVSYGALLALLLATAFMVVIPALRGMKEMPLAYYYSLPVSESSDMDGDGIPDFADGSPNQLNAIAIGEDAVEEDSLATTDVEA